MVAEGFEDWYRSDRGTVIAALRAMSASIDLAEECADEAFARALARWPTVGKMNHRKAWVLKVALNRLKRVHRRRGRERTLLQQLPHPVTGNGPEDNPDLEVWQAVGGLAPRQRLAIVLRYVGDLSEHEVAEVMGITRGTVASTLSDARRALAPQLAALDPSEVPHG